MMRRSRAISAFLSLVMVLGTESAVYSQPAAPPVGKGDQADAMFRKGNALYKEQRYVEAKAVFDEAFRLKKAHDIAANLGYAEMKLNLFRDAAEHLSLAVRIWPPTGKDDKRQYAVDRLALVKKEVGTLAVQVNVPHAEVFVDGKSIGVAPFEGEVFVEPGKRTIEAKLAGYVDAKQVIEAPKGSAQAVTLTLGASAPVPSVTATSNASAPPAASGVPTAPPIKEELPAGPSKAIVGAGAGVAGAALVAGVVFTVLANGKASAADQKHDLIMKAGGQNGCAPASSFAADCKLLLGWRQEAATFTGIGVGAFIGAGVVGAATLVYALTSRPKAPASRARVAPLIGAQGGGISVAGRW